MSEQIEQLDVLIIGAGISGIGMAYNLINERPNDSFAVIESRDNIGGTWDYHKYPGLRSDSDMYTFAYSFKPWRHREYIGSADRIMGYLNELIDDEGIRDTIRFNTRIISAHWHSEKNVWVCEAKQGNGKSYTIEAKFMVTCTGYYNYEGGYTPQFKGVENFKGDVIHPQKWPENYDYTNKDVIVIGSGATAFTIVPVMAEKTKSMTMVQRSPSYVYNRPSSDGLFRLLSKFMPAGLTNSIMRFKYVCLQQFGYGISKAFPNFAKKLLVGDIAKAADGAVDIDTHFTPKYAPWDQRVCMVPDNDMFESIKQNKTQVITQEIDCFTENGLRLKDGTELNADLIVTATGLDVQLWGGMDIQVDGINIVPKKLTNYKGMMFSQLPNMLTIFGYTNSSWTLKAELTYDYVCRLLGYMEKHKHKSVFPYQTPGVVGEGLVGLTSGYIQRAESKLPKQGDAFPWRNKDFYFADVFAIKRSKLADGVLCFDDTSSLKPFHEKTHELAKQEITAEKNDKEVA